MCACVCECKINKHGHKTGEILRKSVFMCVMLLYMLMMWCGTNALFIVIDLNGAYNLVLTAFIMLGLG